MGKYGYRWLCFRSTFCYVSILKCCLRKIHQPDKMHHNMTKKQSKPSGPKKGCFWVPMYGIWFYSKLEFVYFVLFFYFDIFWLIWLRFITVYPYLSVHPTWSWQEESLMDFLHRAPDPPEDRSVRRQKRRKRRCCEDSALRLDDLRLMKKSKPFLLPSVSTFEIRSEGKTLRTDGSAGRSAVLEPVMANSHSRL